MKFNGKTLTIPEFTFNTMIDLEEKGVSLGDLDRTPMKFIRAIIAISLGVSDQDAGIEIQKHIQSGGKFDELVKLVGDTITESGFIKALQNE